MTFLTLVTLDCDRLDIATSVRDVAVAVYSPPVLLLRDQACVDGMHVESR